MEFGKWASQIHSPEAFAPDPFFGGSARSIVQVQEVPQLREDLKFYWVAWQDLRSERNQDGIIPWRALRDYAKEYQADLYLLKLIVWEVDQAFLNYSREATKKNKVETDGRSRNTSNR